MRVIILVLTVSLFSGASYRTGRVFESPLDPLKHMEIRTTQKCNLNINSGRYGCARNCANCADLSVCKKWHGGVDLSASQNTDFYAVFSGRKVTEGFSKSWGFFVMIESADVKDINGLKYDIVTLIYCHLNPSQVIPSFVHQGQKLGLTGNTGNALNENPHLHLEAYTGKYVQADRSNTADAELFLHTSFGANANNSTCHPDLKIADDDCCGELKHG